ncbi:MAG: phosphate acyltransferase PlsX [Gammaproteobacteria bacterium]|nr:phosphate acyltransferase PlsX [Gammaproteobacteria bacterium]
MHTIALDAMGGDHGAKVVVAAAKQVLDTTKNLRLILVGDQEVLAEELNARGMQAGENLRIQHASQKVEMDESPAVALRSKKDSSMRVAINLVKQGEAQAAVSAGNTGALMATAKFVLKTLPGIDRPAICSSMPTINGHTHVLDLGANVGCEPKHLMQFAVMGSVLVSSLENIPNPTVGVLNIGEEDIKGDETVKASAKLIAQTNLNYYGFVEGDDIFKGTVDVVVCDGFVGNVALKTGEGVAKMISHFMKQEFKQSFTSKIAALFALPVLNRLKKRIDPREYNGASFLGLQGIVIKSHGSADEFSFANAIRVAIAECDQNVPQKIANQLEEHLLERHAV